MEKGSVLMVPAEQIGDEAISNKIRDSKEVQRARDMEENTCEWTSCRHGHLIFFTVFISGDSLISLCNANLMCTFCTLPLMQSAA